MDRVQSQVGLESLLLKSLKGSNLVFVHGKGGVGKTLISQSIAYGFCRTGRRTLWITLEDPALPREGPKQILPNLFHLNCDFFSAFEEYAKMKVRFPGLAHFFSHNPVIRGLGQTAPGVKDLVLLGKVWHERLNYDTVVLDMPATGHGLALFQSTQNFSRLFQNGPLYRDAEEMLKTFGDPALTSHLVLGIPEETPLREALELGDYLRTLFPKNPPQFLLNQLFPGWDAVESALGDPDQFPNPIATTYSEYVIRRQALEHFNLRIWREAGMPFFILEKLTSPVVDLPTERIWAEVAEALFQAGLAK